MIIDTDTKIALIFVCIGIVITIVEVVKAILRGG